MDFVLEVLHEALNYYHLEAFYGRNAFKSMILLHRFNFYSLATYDLNCTVNLSTEMVPKHQIKILALNTGTRNSPKGLAWGLSLTE